MDTINMTTQTPSPAAPQAPQSAPIVPQQPVISQQPSVSYTGGNKEAAPVAARTEYVTPAPVESAPTIPKELEVLGIEVTPQADKPDVAPAVQDATKQPVPQIQQVAPGPQGMQIQTQTLPQQSPLTYPQAVANLKTHKADESISWLSMLSKYILEKLGVKTL